MVFDDTARYILSSCVLPASNQELNTHIGLFMLADIESGKKGLWRKGCAIGVGVLPADFTENRSTCCRFSASSPREAFILGVQTVVKDHGADDAGDQAADQEGGVEGCICAKVKRGKLFPAFRLVARARSFQAHI